MFLKASFPIIIFIFKIFGIFILAVLSLLVPFFLSCFGFLIYYRFIKKVKFKKRSYVDTSKTRHWFVRIFFDFPQRFILDRLASDPDEFDLYGLWCFTGQQGSGKSIALVEMLHRIKRKFPLVRVLSNIDLTGVDSETISGPEDFVFQDNGKDGTIVILDEAQNWFNSAESKNFPVEVLQEICQERKQHKMVCLTTQRFNRLSAAIREQIDYYVKPMTIAGCLTIVRVYRPQIKEFEAAVVKLRRIKTYFFVHSDDLRGSYDTLAKVQRLTLKGWKPRTEQILNDIDTLKSKE